jgi:hypothetical protein
MDSNAGNENNADRECTPGSRFENHDWVQMLPSAAHPRPMNRDPKQNATIYGEYRALCLININHPPTPY